MGISASTDQSITRQPEPDTTPELNKAQMAVAEAEVIAETQKSNPNATFLDVLSDSFDQFDIDNDGHISDTEIDENLSKAGITADQKASLETLKEFNSDLEEYSNDEYLDENDGVTKADLDKFSQTYDEDRQEVDRDFRVEQARAEINISPLTNISHHFKNYIEGDGKIDRIEMKVIEGAIEDLKDPALKKWAENAMQLFEDHSTLERYNEREFAYVPKDDVVKDLINPERMELVADRMAEARTHPTLDLISDPQGREQMQEFLVRYMSDPVFMAVDAERTINRGGTATNFLQSLSTHAAGSNELDADFGACIECQAHVQQIFTEFKNEWGKRTENDPTDFKLEVGNIREKYLHGVEHNLSYVRVGNDDNQTITVDPWGSQDTSSESVQTRESYLQGFREDTLGTGNIVNIDQDDTTVHTPANTKANFVG